MHFGVYILHSVRNPNDFRTTIPEIVKKTEEYRAAGMIGDIKLDLGFEAMEQCDFLFSGITLN